MKTFIPILAALAASSAVAAAPLPCQQQSLLDPGSIAAPVILAGELHGTNEMPAFVSALACGLLQGGQAVLLSLELPADVQPVLEQYMASDGGTAARQALYASRFGKLNDGRGSLAYVDLIEQARRLRQAGARISVAATDITGAQWDAQAVQDNNTRDRLMAANIVALARSNPQARVVSLSGNLHASQARSDGYEPMGYVVAQQLRAYSIGFQHQGGQAWVCLMDKQQRQDCKAHRMGAQKGLVLPGYDRMVALDGLTASPPAASQ